jgi:hypothetical protein
MPDPEGVAEVRAPMIYHSYRGQFDLAPDSLPMKQFPEEGKSSRYEFSPA